LKHFCSGLVNWATTLEALLYFKLSAKC